MITYKRILIVLAFAAIAAAFNCGGEPIFTNMEENSLKVVIKGSYESDTTQPWNLPGTAAGMRDTDSVILYDTCTLDVKPTVFMLDIAEMRLIDDRGEDHKFSNIRQGFTAPLDASSAFFNGTGICLDCDDAPSGTYYYVQVYVRKMVFDGAQQYSPSATGWVFEKTVQTNFFENTVNGFNFNAKQVQTYSDSLTYSNGRVNRVFPITIPIAGGMTLHRNEPRVLEIRLNLKNFIKLYEYETYTTDGYRIVHYYGPSDWLRNVKARETTIGGNIPVVARSYKVGETGTISGNVGGTRIIIAVPAGTPITDFTLNNTTINRGSNATINCDMLQLIDLSGASAEKYLDYYLNNEDYLEKWNDRITGANACPDYTTYDTLWTNYESEVSNFHVPMLATYTSGNYSIVNVAPGTYDVYSANVPVTYATLFTDLDFTLLNSGPVSAGGVLIAP